MRTAIASANVNQAKGSFDGPSRAYTIDANDQLRSAADCRAVIVAYRNGAPVLLSDVADIVEDAENVRLAAWMNEVPAELRAVSQLLTLYTTPVVYLYLDRFRLWCRRIWAGRAERTSPEAR